MAALERSQIRLNGYISADTDEALFHAMTGVHPYKRMALLRRLAYLGLMAEQGRLPAAPQVTPAATQVPPIAGLSEAPPATTMKTGATQPAIMVVSEPKTLVPERSVTAKPEKHPDASPPADAKQRSPKLAIMRRANLSMMD